ncbi:UbiD family decarboxylase [Lutibaculum baratangense]|uniref:3-polyprenyl-4-hydroxybenzoate carboxy-lyase n=1 Tax=Lutibaculum baratangense AMV1 TaxID=631454 RepID=V4RNK6_9HYPH|nr:UbiD family decarboxylase [Lutibaculum baratangense]ESR26854.1 3-polyprenyl-4-hydroxybenzoate carboxy-lyase [Lutibaculum baratangense AMV1]
MNDRATTTYRDLHDHIAELERRDLLVRVDREIDKDAEMHPLVRWQFVGGLKEEERKAFLFTNIRDGKGRKYDIPVIVGGLAANKAIYATGMGCDVSEIQAKWDQAIAHPIPPREVEAAPCHEIVETGEILSREGHGIDILPIPVSTPGFDSAPTLSATNVITKDPESGIQNMGTYRCALKAPDRLAVRMATRVGGAGGYQHYLKHQARGDGEMPVAIVLGCPPYVAFMGPQKLPLDLDEFDVAGGLAGAPINVVKAKTVDLMVPAEAEIVIEGYIDTTKVEPEGPFGESHGHVALEEYNMPMRVTAVTRRRDAVVPSYISQVAPSESSVIKRVAYEPLFLRHLRDTMSIKGVKKVSLHEPLTGLLRVTVVTVADGTPPTEIWRALYGAAFFKGDCGKICIAVNDDIDVDSPDAILWAMAYRTNPIKDMQTLPHRGQGHGPKREHKGEEDSTLLVDATMKSPMPPLALPTQEYMERAKGIWEEMGLPRLVPQSPWHGYSLGAWHPYWDASAARAAAGDYLENGRISLGQQQPGLKPESRFNPETGEPE